MSAYIKKTSVSSLFNLNFWQRNLKLPSISLRALRVWQRNMECYKKFYKANLLGALGEPLMYLFGMGVGIGGYLSSIQGMTYIQFIAPGLLMATSMYTATFECTFGAYTRMVEQKTYDAIISTPLNVGDVVMGDILWGATKSLISGSIMFLIIVLAGLMKGSFILIIPIFCLIFLMGLLFASIAMTATALSPSYDFFSYYFSLVLTPMFFFSGIFFPLTKYPIFIRVISFILPLTHAVNMSRSLITGNISYILFLGIPVMMAFTVVFMILAVNSVEKRIIQ